jgi:hypothetical protein
MGDTDDINTAKFAEFMARKVGTRRWAVSDAPKLTGKMKALGYDKLVSYKQLDAFKQEFSEKYA